MVNEARIDKKLGGEKKKKTTQKLEKSSPKKDAYSSPQTSFKKSALKSKKILANLPEKEVTKSS